MLKTCSTLHTKINSFIINNLNQQSILYILIFVHALYHNHPLLNIISTNNCCPEPVCNRFYPVMKNTGDHHQISAAGGKIVLKWILNYYSDFTIETNPSKRF